jgi:futalosine hydrolase
MNQPIHHLDGASAPVLHCAATRDELEALGYANDPHQADRVEIEPGRVWGLNENIFAITGVGIPHTLLNLPGLIERFAPRLIVNAGIAGAYTESGLMIGEVVLGTSEVFADLGMELPTEVGFSSLGDFAFADPSLHAPLPLSAPDLPQVGLKRGRGATVNMCTGTAQTGARRRRLFNVDFETMEGAAVALAARARHIPVLEIRAISNMAAQRDMQPHNMRHALSTLAHAWSQHGVDLVRAALPKAPYDTP